MPILTIAGELDGLMRVSRIAESFYHTNKNIQASQASQFNTVVIKGVNHALSAGLDL